MTDQATAQVSLKIDNDIALVTLENERKLNALTIPMLTQLEAICAKIEPIMDLRAVIITGSGERAFCCGADIKEWGGMAPFDFARNWVRNGHRIFDRLARLSCPTIAAINGHAFGGGLELVATCDLRVMTPKATLSLPEAAVGVVPGWSGTQRLSTQIPPAILKSMALLGHRMSAEEANRLGVVNAVSDDPLKTAFEMAEKIKTLAPRSVEINKAMISAGLGEDVPAILEELGGGLIASSQDKAEGVAAFSEKRKPIFTGQ